MGEQNTERERLYRHPAQYDRQKLHYTPKDPISTFLYWRMNWHTEHHMYAGVPCYNLIKLVRAIAADMPEPRTLLGAWREMLQIWNRQLDDPDYQYDTPLPVTAGDTAQDEQDNLEGSIGVLAPSGLR